MDSVGEKRMAFVTMLGWDVRKEFQVYQSEMGQIFLVSKSESQNASPGDKGWLVYQPTSSGGRTVFRNPKVRVKVDIPMPEFRDEMISAVKSFLEACKVERIGNEIILEIVDALWNTVEDKNDSRKFMDMADVRHFMLQEVTGVAIPIIRQSYKR